MKIVRPYARIITEDHYALRRIAWSGRISHRSEDANQENDTVERFIKAVVVGHGDWSIVEHVTASVDILTDRGITHELVRHRLFSFTQESTRFVNYEKKMPPSWIYPKPDVECEMCLGGDEAQREAFIPPSRLDTTWFHERIGVRMPCAYSPRWLAARFYDELEYKGYIADGWRPQEARSGLPNALASRIVMTGNLRNWRHFFIMRTTAEAHPQMRQIAIPLLADFQNQFPILYDDIEPNVKQSEGMKKAR